MSQSADAAAFLASAARNANSSINTQFASAGDGKNMAMTISPRGDGSSSITITKPRENGGEQQQKQTTFEQGKTDGSSHSLSNGTHNQSQHDQILARKAPLLQHQNQITRPHHLPPQKKLARKDPPAVQQQTFQRQHYNGSTRAPLQQYQLHPSHTVQTLASMSPAASLAQLSYGTQGSTSTTAARYPAGPYAQNPYAQSNDLTAKGAAATASRQLEQYTRGGDCTQVRASAQHSTNGQLADASFRAAKQGTQTSTQFSQNDTNRPQTASKSSLVLDVLPLHPCMFRPTNLSQQQMWKLMSPQDAALVQNVQLFCFRKRMAKPNEYTFGELSWQTNVFLPYLANVTLDWESVLGIRCKCCAFVASIQGRPQEGSTRFPTSIETLTHALRSLHFHLAAQCPYASKALRDMLHYQHGKIPQGQISLNDFLSWYCDAFNLFQSPSTESAPAPPVPPPPPPTLADESFEELQDAVSEGLARHYYARLGPAQKLVASDLNDLPWSHDQAESPFVAHLLECLEMVQTRVTTAETKDDGEGGIGTSVPDTTCEEVKDGEEQTGKESEPGTTRKPAVANNEQDGKKVPETAFVIQCRYCHGTFLTENADEYDQAFLNVNRFFNNTTKSAKAAAWLHVMGYGHADQCPHVPLAVKFRLSNLRPGVASSSFRKNAWHLSNRFKQWVEWIQEVLLGESIDDDGATEDVEIWIPLSGSRIRKLGNDYVEPEVVAPIAPTKSLPAFFGHFGVRYNDVVVNVNKAREHSGNKRFRLLVSQLRRDYLTASFTGKKLVARALVRTVQDRGGRIGTLSDNDGFRGYSFDDSVKFATNALVEGIPSLLRPIPTKRGPGSLVSGCEVAPHYGVLHGKLLWPKSSNDGGSLGNPLRKRRAASEDFNDK